MTATPKPCVEVIDDLHLTIYQLRGTLFALAYLIDDFPPLHAADPVVRAIHALLATIEAQVALADVQASQAYKIGVAA